MRSALDILRNLPILRNIAEREQFDAVASVTVNIHDEFVAARDWCKAEWKEGRGRYRIVEGSRRLGNGTFEFADVTLAVDFSLRFG